MDGAQTVRRLQEFTRIRRDAPVVRMCLTLLRAFSHLETFVPRCEGAFTFYLRRILLNVLADHGRKAARAPEPSSRALPSGN